MERGKDEVVRRAVISYQNASEDVARFTDRGARSLIKLFNIDDNSWQQEMDVVSKLIDEANLLIAEPPSSQFTMKHTGVGLKYKLSNNAVTRKPGVQHSPMVKSMKVKHQKACNKCCCFSHCHVTNHEKNMLEMKLFSEYFVDQPSSFHLLDKSWQSLDEYKEELLSTSLLERDPFMSLKTAVQMDLEM